MTAGRLPGPGDVERLRELAERADVRCPQCGTPNLALAAAEARIANLVRIANVNGDWNVKILDYQHRAEQAEARADALQRAVDAVRAIQRRLDNGSTVGVIRQTLADELRAALAAADAPQPEGTT